MSLVEPGLLPRPSKKVRFAAGKGTAFVVDVGQSMASVTPVVDGFVLRKGELFWKEILDYLTLPRPRLF